VHCRQGTRQRQGMQAYTSHAAAPAGGRLAENWENVYFNPVALRALLTTPARVVVLGRAAMPQVRLAAVC